MEDHLLMYRRGYRDNMINFFYSHDEIVDGFPVCKKIGYIEVLNTIINTGSAQVTVWINEQFKS